MIVEYLSKVLIFNFFKLKNHRFILLSTTQGQVGQGYSSNSLTSCCQPLEPSWSILAATKVIWDSDCIADGWTRVPYKIQDGTNLAFGKMLWKSELMTWLVQEKDILT